MGSVLAGIINRPLIAELPPTTLLLPVFLRKRTTPSPSDVCPGVTAPAWGSDMELLFRTDMVVKSDLKTCVGDNDSMHNERRSLQSLGEVVMIISRIRFAFHNLCRY